MRNFFLALFLVLLVSYTSKAQWCGTVRGVKQEALDASILAKQAFNIPDLCLKRELSVYIHLVLDSLGKTLVKVADINKAFVELNKDFSPICLSFKVCKIDSIRNWKYNDKLSCVPDPKTGKTEYEELKRLYCVDHVINVFIVKDTDYPSYPGANWADLPAGGAPPSETQRTYDGIVLTKPGLTGGKVVSHEFGHFMGLYHTFEGNFSPAEEFVNESNCATNGDLICDTEADNYDKLHGGPQVTNNCTFIGTDKDPNGDFYTPPIDNIMSYHPCPCRFTVGQYNRMAQVYMNYRHYLH